MASPEDIENYETVSTLMFPGPGPLAVTIFAIREGVSFSCHPYNFRIAWGPETHPAAPMGSSRAAIGRPGLGDWFKLSLSWRWGSGSGRCKVIWLENIENCMTP